MGDGTAKLESASVGATVSRRVQPVVVWLLVLLVAAVAFGAAVVYAGGISGVEGMLGSLFSGSSNVNKPGAPQSVGAMGGASKEQTTSAELAGLPPDALQRMFAEQLRSQASINALVDGECSSLALGTPVVTGREATIPVSAHFRQGGTVQGRITLRRFNKLWYFFSIDGNDKSGTTDDSVQTSYDPAVVAVITEQQASAVNQDALANGVLGGGFKKLVVTAIQRGEGTASVDFRLSGGTNKPRSGRFVCITKEYASTPYWFVARLEAN